MPNPYAGISGYNEGVADATRAAASVLDCVKDGDGRLFQVGVDIICAISRLAREPRYRRRVWQTPLIAEIADGQNVDTTK